MNDDLPTQNLNKQKQKGKQIDRFKELKQIDRRQIIEIIKNDYRA